MATKKKNQLANDEAQLPLESSQLIEATDSQAFELIVVEPTTPKRRGRSSVQVHQIQKRQSTLRKTFPLIDNLAESPQSNIEQKLINLTLRVVQQTQPNKNNEYKVSFNDVCTALGIDTRNREYITGAADALQSIRMHFNADHLRLCEGNVLLTEERRKFMVLIPTLIYDKGTFIFKINEDIRPYMDDNLQYAVIPEDETSKLKLVASVRLFEYCNKYLHVGMSEKIEWEALRDRLFAVDNYPAKASVWSKFYDRYLVPSIEEINNQTSLFVKLHQFKQGQRVKFLRFEVTRKTAADISSKAQTPAQSQLLAMMAEFPFTKTEINEIFEKYSIPDIQKAYAYTKYKLLYSKKYEIRKPNRYMVRALNAGYFNQIPNAAELVGIVWVDQLSAQPGSGAIVPIQTGNNSLYRLPSKSDVLAYVTSKRSLLAKSRHDELSMIERHEAHTKYNEFADARSKLNVGKRSKTSAMTMFFNWYAKQLFGDVSEEEMTQTENELINDPAGIEYLKKMRSE